MKPVMGYIPAGGRGSRMKPFRLCKELLPIAIPREESTEVVLLIENAIQTLVYGGVKDIVFTVNNEKDALIKCTNDYSIGDHKVQSAYIYQNIQNNEYGLPFVIADAAPFLRGHTVFMKFPDTIVYPYDCFKNLYELHLRKASDLTLGIFPTKAPERLGPVVLNPDGMVLKIQDKPKNPLASNTWNIIIWEDSFLDLTVKMVEEARLQGKTEKELLISDGFERTMETGLSVYGYMYEDGFCHDVSCVEDVLHMWRTDPK